MALTLPSPDWIAVAIAAAAYWILGWIWWSKWAFGKTWMELVGKTEDQLKEDFSPVSMVGMLILNFFSATILAWLIIWSEATSFIDGVSLALLVALGFTVPIEAGEVFYEGRSWGLFLITAGYHVCGVVIMGLILIGMA